MKYAQQELVIGPGGQEKLRQSTIAIVGVGALGTVSAELLARAGIGTLILIDRDVVEVSNLQRQSLFGEKDVDKSKAHVAKENLKYINSEVKVISRPIHLSSHNIDVLKDADLIIDGTDNMKTRFLISDYCRKKSKTWIYGAAIKTAGYVMPIFPYGPQLHDFARNIPLETCSQVGVLNSITTTIAAMQVSLAIQIITEKSVDSKLYYIDVWNMKFKELNVGKKKELEGYPHLEQSDEMNTIHFCGSSRYQIKTSLSYNEIKERLDNFVEDEATLRLGALTIFKDGRVLIKAQSQEEAQSLFSKVIGN